MADVGKLQEVLNAALKQAGEESSLLLGQTLSIEDNDALKTDKKSYLADTEDAMVVVGVESREEYPGLFYMIFSLRDAILLSSMLLGIPPARISEKRKLAIMEPDDYDAFGEIMNQVIGSFNSVLKPLFPNKLHLKLLSSNKFVPGMDELTEQAPVPDDEYFMFRSPLQMDGVEMDRLDIFIPLSLADMMMPEQEAPAEAAAAEEAAEEAAAEETPEAEAGAVTDEPAGKQTTVLILEEDDDDRRNAMGFLSGTGFRLIEASPGDDIRELLAKAEAKVAVIGVSAADDGELSLCIKVNSLFHEKPVPIIMCAHKWTRTAVLKALKYGARDIIMKPYTADELMGKVKKHLQAA